MATHGTVGRLLAGAALALAANAALAADHTLVISSWAPPTHSINARMWPKFTEMVEAATDGRVTTELKLGLAPPPAQMDPPPAQMDLVMDGAADLSIIFHGYQPGRFVTPKLIELPGYVGTSEAASVAYWRAYDAYLKQADEHRGVKVVSLHTHGGAQLMSAEPVTTLAQAAGMKVRIPGGVAADVGAALGMVGIQVPATKVYETLASRAADGVVMPIDSRVGFKLTEVAQNMYMLPGGLYRGSFAFIMNEDAFAALPEDIRTALEDKVFGEPISRAIGAIWEEGDAEAIAATLAAPGNAILDATPEDVAAFEAVAAGVRDKVIAEVAATGVDAQAAYDRIKAEMAAY